MTRITLHNVSKSYPNGVQAVRDVSLDIAAGEFVVLLGPSGCGKSTTLRMIAGLEDISSGTLLFDGERVNDVEPKYRDIGMVFQNYALYPHLTVFENLAFPLRLRGEDKQTVEERVQAVAMLTGLEALLKRKPKELSGGQRQRVALGRAIIRTPRVFLFDEPLSNLDAQLRAQMRAEISRIQRLVGATAIYVTHDQTEAMTMGDRVVIMNAGFIQQVGTPVELYDNPQTLFVAQFLGSPTMNIISGELVVDDGLWFKEASLDNAPGALSLKLSKQHFQQSPPVVGRTVQLGIRPEHISLFRYEGIHEQMSFNAVVRRREYLGHEVLLFVETSPNMPLKVLRADAASAPYTEGYPLTLYVQPRAVYVFGEDGSRL
jgi:sn-glycerol 3-phosphate transport system ATP-binding protein